MNRLPKRRKPESSGGSRLARGGVLPAAAAASLLLFGACRSTAPAPAPGGSLAVPLGSSANFERFRALQAALEEDDEALARSLIARLQSGDLDEGERELVRSAEHVLAGRTLVRALELALESEPIDGRPGTYRLLLRARSSAPEPVRLALPPADLSRRRATMDARGVEGIELESRLSGALADLTLQPHVERRIELFTYELALGRALAVRERWRLEPRSGEIASGGERYPAARVRVRGCQRERLAPAIEARPVAPGELAGELGGGDPPSARAWLELAVGIPASEREAALAALVPVVQRVARSAPERVAAAEPALRWLTENRELGPDAAGWARYLEHRRRAAPDEERGEAPALDLPENPRPPAALPGPNSER